MTSNTDKPLFEPDQDGDGTLRTLTDRSLRTKHLPRLGADLAHLELTRLARRGPADPKAVLRILLGLVPLSVSDAALRGTGGPAMSLEQTTCGKCGRPMSFVHNPSTGKNGPIDLRAPVYFVLAPDSQGIAQAMTWTELRKRLVSICLREDDGQIRSIHPDQVAGFFVSHFATCPAAGFYSGRNKAKAEGEQ